MKNLCSQSLRSLPQITKLVRFKIIHFARIGDHVEIIRKNVTPTSESIINITQAALLFLLATHTEIHFYEKDEMSRTKFEIKTDSKQVRSEAFPRENVHSNLDLTASACMATSPGYQVTNGLKLVTNQVNFKGHLNQK